MREKEGDNFAAAAADDDDDEDRVVPSLLHCTALCMCGVTVTESHLGEAEMKSETERAGKSRLRIPSIRPCTSMARGAGRGRHVACT